LSLCNTGIEHDIKVWAPTTPQPQVPFLCLSDRSKPATPPCIPQRLAETVARNHSVQLITLIVVLVALSVHIGIEHDIKIWAPTAPQPQAPSPTSLRAAMAANQRERDASREAMSEPEQWLLQLLAAQRRR
jgi:hypothetical protein